MCQYEEVEEDVKEMTTIEECSQWARKRENCAWGLAPWSSWRLSVEGGEHGGRE